MRRLFVLSVLAVIVLPVNGRQDRGQSQSNQENSNAPIEPSAPPPNEAQCIVEQSGTAIKCEWAKEQTKSYLSRLLTAENTPNIALFFVGLGGVVAAAWTLRFINRQTRELRLSRIVTHNSLNAIKRQADLMESAAKDAQISSAVSATLAQETLDALKRQANAMDSQTAILRDSVAVAKQSADAAQSSVATLIAKERARIEVSSGILEVDNSLSMWHLRGTISVRNIGASRAFITRTQGYFRIYEDARYLGFDELFSNSILIEGNILDPSTDPIFPTLHLFSDPWEPEDLTDISHKLYNSERKLVMYGFIEYESMGTKWHHDFAFIRRSGKNGFGEIITKAKAATDEERITGGHWTQHENYRTEEYQVSQNRN